MLLRIPNALDAETARTIATAIADGDFVDGRLTAGGEAATRKNNLQLVKSSSLAEVAGDGVVSALRTSAELIRGARPHTILRPIFARYDVGMSYGTHLDSPIMVAGRRIRSDVSVTMFLSDPEGYDGGELVIEAEGGEQVSYKEPFGSAVLYPSSYHHRVEAVTRGTRIVAVTWIQSLVRSPAKRKILYDLAGAVDAISRKRPEAEELSSLRICHDNLLRMWAET